jgi:DNA-binding NarL/FixJ family response regulator
MKTEYKIVWVDDDFDSVLDDVQDTEDYLESFGIRAIIKRYDADSSSNIHDQVKRDLEDPELDLIVVDFKMDGMNGADLINAVRISDHVFLPVIFYSSVGVEALHAEVAKSSLDGVYVSSRNGVRTKIREVVASLLNKEQTIKRTRGLLMEGLSEIDSKFEEQFKMLWPKLDATQKQKIIDGTFTKIRSRVESADKRAKEIPRDFDGYLKYMNENFLSAKFDTQFRWHAVLKMLELTEHDANQIRIHNALFADNEPALARIRNDYAHKTRTNLMSSHTSAKCVDIRRELRRQYSNQDAIIGKSNE